MGSKNTMTKYCPNSSYGYNGFTDSKTVLDPEDDAAHVNLGGKWRMPTDAEWTELRENCTWEWTTLNGERGRKVTSNKSGYTDKWIFIPAAGYRYDAHFDDATSCGYYWSSSLCDAGNPYNAWYVFFDFDGVYRYGTLRSDGISIRPVYDDSESTNYILHDPTPEDGATGVDTHVYLSCYGHLYDKGENNFEVRVSEKPDMSVLIPRVVRYCGPRVYGVDFELESGKTYYWQVAEFDFDKEAWVIVSPIWHFTTK